MLKRSLGEIIKRMWPMVDPWAGPGGDQRFLTPSLSLEYVFYLPSLLPEAAPRTWPWDSDVMSRASEQYTWLNPLQKSLRFWKAGGTICLFVDTQDKPRRYVPLLINPATHQSGMVCLFLFFLLVYSPCVISFVSLKKFFLLKSAPFFLSLPALHVQGRAADNTQEAPRGSANQQKSTDRDTMDFLDYGISWLSIKVEYLILQRRKVNPQGTQSLQSLPKALRY